MTRVGREFGDSTQRDAVSSVSADANFAGNRFPSYKIGSDNDIIQLREDSAVPSLKEIVARETLLLLEQQKRLSVRDLARRFEKGLDAASKLSNEARWKEVASLDRHVLLKNLRDLLESLRGRVAGRNHDDASEAISMVEALAVQLTQREGELLQERSEVKRLAIFLKQATEDAKKVIEEERAIARAEIDAAKDVVLRVQLAVEQNEEISKDSEKQKFEELMKEVQEARRIKMLHQPTKVMDMEYELQALRSQLKEKSMCIIKLRREIEMSKRVEPTGSELYEISGSESLGSCLQVVTCKETGPDISKGFIQWYRVLADGSKRDVLSGATRPVYAPEPSDVGRILQVEIILDDQRTNISTTGPIDPAPGLGSYVEELFRRADSEFRVVVVQVNGKDQYSSSIHSLHVGKMRIKLCKGRSTKAKETYSTSMQLCGVRGGGNAAAQSLYWQPKKGSAYILAFESARERNAAIMLARRYAFDCNITLAGPSEQDPAAT